MASSINEKSLGMAWIESIRSVLDNGDLHFDEDVSILELRLGPSVSGMLSAALFFSNFQVGGLGQ